MPPAQPSSLRHGLLPTAGTSPRSRSASPRARSLPFWITHGKHRAQTQIIWSRRELSRAPGLAQEEGEWGKVSQRAFRSRSWC